MAEGIPDLLAEHTRLVDEKRRIREAKQTPGTKINYDLTAITHQLVEQAKAQRTEEVRALLTEHAEQGHNGAEIVLEWLSEEDAWWSGRGE